MYSDARICLNFHVCRFLSVYSLLRRITLRISTCWVCPLVPWSRQLMLLNTMTELPASLSCALLVSHHKSLTVYIPSSQQYSLPCPYTSVLQVKDMICYENFVDLYISILECLFQQECLTTQTSSVHTHAHTHTPGAHRLPNGVKTKFLEELENGKNYVMPMNADEFQDMLELVLYNPKTYTFHQRMRDALVQMQKPNYAFFKESE